MFPCLLTKLFKNKNEERRLTNNQRRNVKQDLQTASEGQPKGDRVRLFYEVSHSNITDSADALQIRMKKS